MSEDISKEIARDILLKLIETKALFFQLGNGNMSLEEINKLDVQNVQIVCEAYKQILQTVAASNG